MYVETEHIFKDISVKNKIKDLVDFSFRRTNQYKKYIDILSQLNIDELVCFNRGIETFGFYNLLVERNPDLMVSFMEEGILSYEMDLAVGRVVNISNSVRKKIHRKVLWDNISSFYCYYPSLYKAALTPVQVPRISSNSETVNILREVFCPDISRYTQRYIFFTSVLDFEGGEPIGEYELVSKVAELVGKDNLLVKTHPRDKRTIYIDNGFNVDKNSAIPWEVIQLSGDFSDKVFLTVNSGSVLAGSFMSEKPVRTFYMYKLCNISNNPCCQKNAADVEALLNNQDMKDILSEVSIADRIEDIIVG